MVRATANSPYALESYRRRSREGEGGPRLFEAGWGTAPPRCAAAGPGLAPAPPPWHPGRALRSSRAAVLALLALTACSRLGSCGARGGAPAAGSRGEQAAGGPGEPARPAGPFSPGAAAPTSPGDAASTAGPPVRPPFRCLPEDEPSPAALLHQAARALDEERPDDALGCADEALRLAPRGVRALVLRGEALAALDRVPDAQLALTRALAVDPADTPALAAAADLHVRRLGGAHDALEAGLEQALRGLRALARVPRREPGLAVRLELAAAAALSDLGRPAEALPHAERASALDPEEPAAQSERGFALFELCRFDEARAAFQAALALAPGDAWALHHLGLLAERRGDLAEAERLLGQATRVSPKDFPPPVAMPAEPFAAEVARAVRELPPDDRRALDGIPVQAADLPALADLTEGQPPLSPTILGLFRGPPIDERCRPEDGDPCRSIVLYRRNLARFAHTPAELLRQIRVTLTHELGHLRGEDDDALRDRGLQ